MSADLFAQFGPFSPSGQSTSPPAAQTPARSSQPADDPFAFLTTALSQTKTPTTPHHPVQQASPPTQTRPSWSSWDTLTAVPSPPPAVAAAVAPAAADDDDAWGDFEDVSAAPDVSEAPPPTLPTISTTKYVSYQAFPPAPQLQAPPPPQPRTRVVRSSTIDLMTNTLIHFGDSTQKPKLTTGGTAAQLQPGPTPPKQPQRPADSNVLFDAEDYDGTEGLGLDDDDDDDFGDFETGQPAATALVDLLSLADAEPAAPIAPAARQRKQPPAQLLSVLSFGGTASLASPSAASASYPHPPKSPSFRDRNPFPGLVVSTPSAAAFPTEQVANRTPSPVTVWPTMDSNSVLIMTDKKGRPVAKPATVDDWEAWELADTLGSPDTASALQSASSASRWNWGDDVTRPTKSTRAPVPARVPARVPAKTPAKTPAPAPALAPAPDPAPAPAPVLPIPAVIASPPAVPTISDGTPPPTNVPPPSILLSAFPALLALPDEVLLRPLAGQPAAVRNQVLGDARTVAFLRSYLQLAVVAARIVAGRKQRWHRDRFLAQSMTISAAGSSRGGGMKLAGVDRAQGQREDREAADVVAVWRRHVGKIRSVVAVANAAIAANADARLRHQQPLRIPDLPAETLPVFTAKNVPTAARPCVICGLRRDERVRGVDPDDVPDSFGEWWVEHWGHRVCRNFWAEHEAALRSR